MPNWGFREYACFTVSPHLVVVVTRLSKVLRYSMTFERHVSLGLCCLRCSFFPSPLMSSRVICSPLDNLFESTESANARQLCASFRCNLPSNEYFPFIRRTGITACSSACRGVWCLNPLLAAASWRWPSDMMSPLTRKQTKNHFLCTTFWSGLICDRGAFIMQEFPKPKSKVPSKLGKHRYFPW
jgi:hypothetical protein